MLLLEHLREGDSHEGHNHGTSEQEADAAHEGEVSVNDYNVTLKVLSQGGEEYVCGSMGHDDHTEPFTGYSAEVWGMALAANLVTCLVSLSGALLLLCGKDALLKEENRLYIRMMVALAVGALLSAVLGHVLPEAAELAGGLAHNWQLTTTLLAGIVSAMLVETLSHAHVGRHTPLDDDSHHHHDDEH